MPTTSKPIEWVGSSLDDLRAMPDGVREAIGRSLREAQLGRTSFLAKPLRRFGGADVMEIVKRFDGDTYRVSIPSVSRVLSMSFMSSRRRPSPGSPLRGATWI